MRHKISLQLFKYRRVRILVRILPPGPQSWSATFWSAVYPFAGRQVPILPPACSENCQIATYTDGSTFAARTNTSISMYVYSASYERTFCLQSTQDPLNRTPYLCYLHSWWQRLPANQAKFWIFRPTFLLALQHINSCAFIINRLVSTICAPENTALAITNRRTVCLLKLT